MHPGGPLWANKDDGAWSIPKGEYAAGEDPLACAMREFEEELGGSSAQGREVKSRRDHAAEPKVITGLRDRGDFDPASLKSNRFDLEWPPKSGRLQSFPEVDRAGGSPPMRHGSRSCRDRRPSSTVLEKLRG